MAEIAFVMAAAGEKEGTLIAKLTKNSAASIVFQSGDAKRVCFCVRVHQMPPGGQVDAFASTPFTRRPTKANRSPMRRWCIGCTVARQRLRLHK